MAPAERTVAGSPPAVTCTGRTGDIVWTRPTYAGDVLRVESEIVEIKPSRSKPDQGFATVKSVVSNRRGEEVEIFTAKILAFRRPQ